jgi:3-oxoadipate CoA-transferase alpha subunit
VVELGQLDPETVVTPGIFVSHIVHIHHQATVGGGFKQTV